MGRHRLILLVGLTASVALACKSYDSHHAPSGGGVGATAPPVTASPEPAPPVTAPPEPAPPEPAPPVTAPPVTAPPVTAPPVTAAPVTAPRTDPFEDARRRIDEARQLPIPTGNYRVKVERVWFAEGDSSAIGALVGYADENWDIQAGSTAPDAGFRVGVAKDGFYGVLDGHLRSSRDATREEATLMMVPGYPASLLVGQTRYFVPFHVGGVPYGMVVPDGQFVGTSLETICAPAGPGAVIVTLTPIFSGLGRGGETVRITQATTSVRVPLGRPFLLASHDSSADSVATALLSRRTSSGMERAVLILTVDGG